jgi:pimeloyl-ACP methyl ester carboxylesterase
MNMRLAMVCGVAGFLWSSSTHAGTNAVVPIVAEVKYSSTADGTGPLYATAVFVPDGIRKPVLAVLHGFGDVTNDTSYSANALMPDLQPYAQLGLFCIAPDMRGHGKSAGKHDASGLDVHDILDGIQAAIAQHPTEADARNINFVGGSGGGGNCFAAFVRFPDTFHVMAEFYGISDYGEWARLTPHRVQMALALGGTPKEKPLDYAARNFIQAAGNNRKTRLHMYWDESETVCPAVLDDRFLEAYLFAGGTNAVAHISRDGDPVRFWHGPLSPRLYGGHADQLVPEMKTPVSDLSLPRRGTLTVCGYLVCRQFKVYVEDGTRGVVKIAYDVSRRKPKVVVTDNPDHLKVTILGPEETMRGR